MAALSMYALSTAAEPCCTASSSSSSSSAACSSSTQRWSKETLKAMETHLSLLQKNRVPTIAKLASQAPLVDLSAHLQAPLPFGWEQHLDLRTGRVYYMDWQSCKRSYNDPRKALRRANDRIIALVQQAAQGQWELQSSVTQELATPECIFLHSKLKDVMPLCRDQEEDMEVESKWTPPVCTNECLLEGMEAQVKSIPYVDAACLFNGTIEHASDEAESGWDLDVASACSYNCAIEPPSDEAYCEDHHDMSLGLNPKLEMLRCHHCFSHIIIHVANPWCPKCAQSLV